MIEKVLENNEKITKEVYVKFINEMFTQPYLCVGIKKDIKEISEENIKDVAGVYLFDECREAKYFQKLNPKIVLYYIENFDFVKLFSVLKNTNTNVFYCYFINKKYKRAKINQNTILQTKGIMPLSKAIIKKVKKIPVNKDKLSEENLKKSFYEILNNPTNINEIVKNLKTPHLIQLFESIKDFYNSTDNEGYKEIIAEVIKSISNIIISRIFKSDKICVPTDNKGNIIYNIESNTINIYLDYFSALCFLNEEKENERYYVKTIFFYSFVDFIDEIKDNMIKGVVLTVGDASTFIPIEYNTYIDAYGAEIKKTNINLYNIKSDKLFNTNPIVMYFNGKPEFSGALYAFFNERSYDLWVKQHKINGSAVSERISFENIMNYIKNSDTCHGICMFGYKIPNRKMHYIYINKKDFSKIGN